MVVEKIQLSFGNKYAEKNRIKHAGKEYSSVPKELQNFHALEQKNIKKSYSINPSFGYAIYNFTDKTDSIKNPTQEDSSPLITAQELENCNYKNADKNEVILDISKDCPDFARQIINDKVNGKPRFNENETIKIINVYKKYPKETKYLVELKNEDNKTPRLDGNEICYIVRPYKDDPNTINELLSFKNDNNKPRFSGYVISNISKAYAKNPNKNRELIEFRLDNKLRFTGADVCDLIGLYEKNSDSVKELASMKHNDTYRFSGKNIKSLIKPYNENPKEIRELTEITQTNGKPRFEVCDIKYLVDSYKKYPNAVKSLALMETSKNCPRFTGDEIEYLAEVYEKYPEETSELATYETFLGKPKFTQDDIKHAAKFYKNPKCKKIISCNKDIIREMRSRSSENHLEINMTEGKIHIKIDSNGKFQLIGREQQEINGNTKTSKMRTPEGFLKFEEYSMEGTKEVQGYFETVEDKYGRTISTTLTVPSQNNKGVLVILKETYDKNGNPIETKEIGTVKNYGENGERRKIEREFTSPLGVESNQLVLEVPKGKRSKYTIGDKSFERIFKVKDENTTESYAWGNKYETKFNKDNIEVKVTKKDKTSETVVLDNKQVDFSLLPLLKQVPGDFLYNISKENTIVTTTDLDMLKRNAAFVKEINTILISKDLINDPFIFAHEYGHMLDDITLNNLHEDEGLNEIFKKELDAYKETATEMNENEIMYFIAKEHKNEGGCLSEVVAETNAILSGLQHDENEILVRAKIFQENFPETMAYIGSKIEEAMKEK